MPIPTPRPGEGAKEFVSRCMSDEVMLREYPDDARRAAVCYRQLESEGRAMAVKDESLTAEQRDIIRRAQQLNGKKDKRGELNALRSDALLVAGMKVSLAQPRGEDLLFTIEAPGVAILMKRSSDGTIATKVTRQPASKKMATAHARAMAGGPKLSAAQAKAAMTKIESAVQGALATLATLTFHEEGLSPRDHDRAKAALTEVAALVRRGKSMSRGTAESAELKKLRTMIAESETLLEQARHANDKPLIRRLEADLKILRQKFKAAGGNLKTLSRRGHEMASDYAELPGLLREYAASLRETLPRCAVVAHACANSYRAGKRLDKDAIRVGRYVHPREGWELDVDEARIDRWVRNMSRMLAKGVTIPLVRGHVVSCDTTLGYVTAARREGRELRIVTDVPDDAAAAECERVNNVSIFVEKGYRDGTGEEYDETITHVALTPEPVVPGQGGFISIAASSGRASEEVPVYVLAARGDAAVKKELLQRFREVTKAAADAAEDEVMQSVADYLEERAAELARQREELTELRAKLESASAAEPTPATDIDADEIEERASDVVGDIDAMVDAGQLTPALAASLRDELCGFAGARNVYMLSRSELPNEKGIRPIRARALLRLISQVKSVELGSKTGPQAKGLSQSGSLELEGAKLTDRLVGLSSPGKGGVSQIVM